MKVRKILGGLTLLSLILATGFYVLRPGQTAAILLSNATAAPLSDTPGTLAVFVSIENSGAPDNLLSASTPDARISVISGPRSPLAIPAQSTVSLAADGAYLRLSEVSGALNDGRTFPISLTFERAGTVNTRARLIAPRTTGTASQVGLFGIGDICEVGEGEPAPDLTLSTTKSQEGWIVSVDAIDFEFAPDLADGPHVPGTGHGHIYLNGLKLGRLYAPSYKIGKLPSGSHEIRVTLSTNDHRAYVIDEQPVTASIRISSP